MDLASRLMIVFTGLLAVFTALLAVVAIWNARITKKLLKQSEAASKQSRAAFLGDMLVKALSLEERAHEQIASSKSLLEGRSYTEPGSLTEDIAEMLGNIDESLKRDFMRALAGSQAEKEDDKKEEQKKEVNND